MATRAIYNTDVEKYRQAELDYVTRTHSASSEQQSEGFNNLKAYAVIQKHQGQAIDSTLENMLEEGRNQVKALEELAAIHQASETKRANYSGKSNTDQILKHYELVKMIGNVYG